MEKENEILKNELIELIPHMDSVEPLVHERDQTFKDSQKQIANLKSAKIPEPHYKIQGGAYKNPNYKKQKDEAVINLRDKYQKINQEIGNNTIKELKSKGLDDDLNMVKNEGVQNLLDKGIEKDNERNGTDLATNKDIRRFIREQGFNPDKTKDQDKPMDRERTEKIPDPVKSEPKSKEVRSMEKNKKDMGMDRDR